MKAIMGLALASFSLLFLMFPSPTSSAFFTPQNSGLIPLDGLIGLEMKTIPMNIPVDNKLPWGFVEGMVVNPVEGYPVIVQMYKDGEPIHFAQTDVADDGTYEYKFRVRNVDGDQVVNVFQGNFEVKISKVVYLNLDTILA